MLALPCLSCVRPVLDNILQMQTNLPAHKCCQAKPVLAPKHHVQVIRTLAGMETDTLLLLSFSSFVLALKQERIRTNTDKCTTHARRENLASKTLSTDEGIVTRQCY